MAEKIQTRVFVSGDPKESEWPPQFGTNQGGGVFYIDKETKELKEGYPPSNIQRFGEAPYVIQDSIEPYKHPKAMEWTDSRSKLKKLDEITGTITSDKMIKAEPTAQRQREYERKLDWNKSIREAVEMIDSGTAPLSEETKALCEERNETMSKALNFDAFNVAGRKNNAKGKRYKRK